MIYAPHNFPVHDVKVARTPEQVKRGEHIIELAAVYAYLHNLSPALVTQK